MENENIYLQTVDGLLQKTLQNKIPWTTVNPNAVRWTRQGPGPGGNSPIIVTLQKQPHPNPANSRFVLSIQTHGAASTQINSLTNPELKEALDKLYEEALKVASSVSFRILKNLLDGL
jgi:hypothetical protein